MESKKDKKIYSSFVDTAKTNIGRKKSFLLNSIEKRTSFVDYKKSVSIGDFLEKSKAKFEKDELENENTKILRMLNEFMVNEKDIDTKDRLNIVYDKLFLEENDNDENIPDNINNYNKKKSDLKSKENSLLIKQSPIKSLLSVTNSPTKNKYNINGILETNENYLNSETNLLSEPNVKGIFIFIFINNLFITYY
jgi:hypothetical protein